MTIQETSIVIKCIYILYNCLLKTNSRKCFQEGTQQYHSSRNTTVSFEILNFSLGNGITA